MKTVLNCPKCGQVMPLYVSGQKTLACCTACFVAVQVQQPSNKTPSATPSLMLPGI